MRRKVIKNIDPFEFFLKAKAEKDICFFYSHTENGWEKILAIGACDRFVCKGEESKDFELDLEKFIDKNLRLQRKIFGFISYDIGYVLYNLKRKAKDDLGLPNIYFVAFDNWLRVDENRITAFYKEKTFLGEVRKINSRNVVLASGAESKNFKPEMKKTKYEEAYKKIKRYIKDGDIYQINLTQRLRGETTLSSKELFLRVLRANPVDFLAYMECGDFEVISASPERFIKIKGRQIETYPVKGTRPRGKNKKEDERLKKELMDSEKEAAELNMITDLLRNDLGKVCKVGSVKVTGTRLVDTCPTVFHTYSRISGVVREGISSMGALLSMLPGGSVTGCPKKRAMEIIDELEPNTRGLYTGVIGQIGPGANFDFNIAIRTIIRKGNGLFLQVGGGIVLDSKMGDEFNETLIKAKSFMNIL